MNSDNFKTIFNIRKMSSKNNTLNSVVMLRFGLSKTIDHQLKVFISLKSAEFQLFLFKFLYIV